MSNAYIAFIILIPTLIYTAWLYRRYLSVFDLYLKHKLALEQMMKSLDKIHMHSQLLERKAFLTLAEIGFWKGVAISQFKRTPEGQSSENCEKFRELQELECSNMLGMISSAAEKAIREIIEDHPNPEMRGMVLRWHEKIWKGF
jgi:hypothetical protein